MASEKELNDLLGALKEAGLGPDQDEVPWMEEDEFLKDTGDGEDDEAWNAGLDDLLQSAENLNQETAQKTEAEEPADVTQIIDNMPGSDEDLNEINELLKKSDSNETVKDDTSPPPESAMEPDPEEKPAKKEKKKKKGKLPWGKKKSDAELSEEETEGEEDSEAQQSEEQKPKEMSLKDIEKEDKSGAGKKKEKKKKKEAKEDKSDGFWKRFSEIVFGEEEEEEPNKTEEKPADANNELLKQLEKGDKSGAGKKKEKNKKDKKDKKPKKEKKPKEKKVKEKKQKPKVEKEKVKEPPSKPIGKKNLFLATILGASSLAAILLINVILTEVTLKQNLESAYAAGNYEEVYQLLYGKKLNEEETQLFGRAAAVLQLQRKLDSYEFYKESGDELQALDSLLKGAAGYQELAGVNTYGASEELLRIYQVILEHLNLDYGVDEDTAARINACENRQYSVYVHAIINGTSSPEPAAEDEIPAAEEGPQDILPEEEDIIDLETSGEGA